MGAVVELTAENVRAYLERSWGLLERMKRDAAAEHYRRGGPHGSRAAALRLLARWRSLHPEASTTAARSADLAAHVALKGKLERARTALR